jgi:hypothetical protein
MKLVSFVVVALWRHAEQARDAIDGMPPYAEYLLGREGVKRALARIIPLTAPA